MSSPEAGRRDFFISFNSADRAWAEWIAAELEAHGYTTFFQHWDFRPGSNFVLEMHKAATLSDRTIAVLSHDYLNALFTQPEWAAALVLDPTGAQRTLVPVRVHDCKPDGILKSVIYVDLVGLSEEQALACLLAAVSDRRPKPDSVPFPSPSEKPFPGLTTAHPARPIPTEINTHHAKPPSASTDRFWHYAGVSLVFFLLFAGLLILMLWKVETLAAFGLTGTIYFGMLVPLGLAAAGFLFGVMQSVAIYRGQRFNGKLVVGGPILAAALVVWGGFALPRPEPRAFSMTVFVHGRAGRQDVLLRGQGQVVMDLGGNRRPEPIDQRGAAHFPGIPAEFRGREIPISIVAPGFERVDTSPRRLSDESLYLAIRRSAARLAGIVLDERGEPLVGAAIDIDGFLGKTDAAGRFELMIPGDRLRPEMTMDVRASGFQSQTLSVVPGSNEIRVGLFRDHN